MPAALSPVRPLGNTGVTVPLIGYGTAPLGKEKNIPRAEARALPEPCHRPRHHLPGHLAGLRQRAARRRGDADPPRRGLPGDEGQPPQPGRRAGRAGGVAARSCRPITWI